ncbi:DUF7573 domain-containing protein [Halomarina pelagica]|uniref:DUF7573 domain-containing protein n=1 Tax=Halomarina pelagica TaxID=2961599 RepID=UPI0020C2B9D7|nr:hypothetical protein [Halomarina sp. BND7]
MQRDRSLDEFLGESPSASASASDADAETHDAPDDAGVDAGDVDTGDAEATDASGTAVGSPEDALDDSPSAPDGLPAGLPLRPAAATMAWTPGGAPCEACEERVERRWRDGDRLVCEACKEW